MKKYVKEIKKKSCENQFEKLILKNLKKKNLKKVLKKTCEKKYIKKLTVQKLVKFPYKNIPKFRLMWKFIAQLSKLCFQSNRLKKMFEKKK